MVAMPRTSLTRGSRRSESERTLSPRRRGPTKTLCPGGSSTTTRSGMITPLAPISRSAFNPSPDSDCCGNQLRAGSPMRIWVSGKVSSAMAMPPPAIARQGRCNRKRAHRSHPVGAWNRASGRASQRGRSMLRPKYESTAGRNVVASSTAMPTTSRPPMPTDRVSVMGVVVSAAKPTTTVIPDVTTAEPAVSIVRIAASTGDRPRFISSRNRVTMSSE